jgi:hypothetical protein
MQFYSTRLTNINIKTNVIENISYLKNQINHRSCLSFNDLRNSTTINRKSQLKKFNYRTTLNTNQLFKTFNLKSRKQQSKTFNLKSRKQQSKIIRVNSSKLKQQ